MSDEKFEEWKAAAKEHHYLTNDWLEYIIKSDGIISDRGYKEICQSAIDIRKANRELYDALNDMINLIDEHGDKNIKAHATKILKARKLLDLKFEI